MNGNTIAIAGILFGALQAIGLAVLWAVWNELGRIRERLHKVENDVAAVIALDRVKKELRNQ